LLKARRLEHYPWRVSSKPLHSPSNFTSVMTSFLIKYSLFSLLGRHSYYVQTCVYKMHVRNFPSSVYALLFTSISLALAVSYTYYHFYRDLRSAFFNLARGLKRRYSKYLQDEDLSQSSILQFSSLQYELKFNLESRKTSLPLRHRYLDRQRASRWCTSIGGKTSHLQKRYVTVPNYISEHNYELTC
jgi:hypothetical protein